MRQVLTPDDLKKGDIVPPGWYPCEISEYNEKPADSDKSTNCIFTFKVLDGEHKGKTGNKLMNEKALGFGKKLWPLIIPGWDKEKGGELSTDKFRQSVGKKLKVYFETGKSTKNNEFNDPTDFMPLS